MKRTNDILAVEESGDGIMRLRQAFAAAGCKKELHVVNDSTEGVEYIQGQDAFADRGRYPFPSLVLVDLNVGQKDGIDLLRWLTQHPKLRKQMAVLAWTGIEIPRLVNQAYGLNANSVLIKPSDYKELERVVKIIKHYWLDLHLVPSSGAIQGI
jgi:CheY-like chemotaxis protein